MIARWGSRGETRPRKRGASTLGTRAGDVGCGQGCFIRATKRDGREFTGSGVSVDTDFAGVQDVVPDFFCRIDRGTHRRDLIADDIRGKMVRGREGIGGTLIVDASGVLVDSLSVSESGQKENHEREQELFHIQYTTFR